MSSCIIMRGKIASETSTRGSSRIRDEPSSSSSSCNNKVVQQHKGRTVLPLVPKEAQTQSTILSANSSNSNNRGTPTTETSARAFHKASKKESTLDLVAWSIPKRGELPPQELLQPTHLVPIVAEEAVMVMLSHLVPVVDNKISEDE